MRRPRRLSLTVSAVGLGIAVGGAWLCSRQTPLEALELVVQARWSGYGALTLLILSQVMSPAARLGWVPPPLQAAARRDLGIAGALLATVHTVLQWRGLLAGGLLNAIEDNAWLQPGVVAWLLLVVLWLTSYSLVVRALRLKVWASLHRLAYPALGLAWLHAYLSPWSLRPFLLLLGSMILLSWIFRCTNKTFMVK